MQDSNKQFTIATAIPYLNAKAHIGHALEYVFSDVIARYHKQQREDVVAIMGADEHGQKIARSAEESNVTPQQYVDSLVPDFLRLHTALGISYDAFVRTTSTEHAAVVQAFWKKVQAAGFIDEREYEGLYCVGCEAFKTEAELVDGKCPDHLKEPEVVREKNYFFQLSKFQQPLLAWYDTHPEWIVPQAKMNEMRAFIERGLEDISISRDVSKMSWGIPVPDDDSQVMYVWFDALPNYLTGAGVTPEMIASRDCAGSRWPVDIINLGKDINRFHAILFAAMLMAADLPLPKQLAVHGFISVNGQKMSKSIGNVIDPFELIELFGAEPTRYLLVRLIGFNRDGDLSKEKIQEYYESDLQNGIGNAFSRVTNLIEKNFNGQLKPIHHGIGEGYYDIAMDRYPKVIIDYEFDAALVWIQSISNSVDELMQQHKPWELAKEGKQEEAQKILEQLLFYLMTITKMLTPFMPETAKKMHDILSADVIRKPEIGLFPRIELNK